MKIINRSLNVKPINWFNSSDLHNDVEKVVKNFKDLILANGTSALDSINKKLGLARIKTYKVSSLSKADGKDILKSLEELTKEIQNIKKVLGKFTTDGASAA